MVVCLKVLLFRPTLTSVNIRKAALQSLAGMLYKDRTYSNSSSSIIPSPVMKYPVFSATFHLTNSLQCLFLK